MRGDILDVKYSLAQLLKGSGFAAALTAVIAEKQPTVPNPIAMRPPTVYTYERLTKLMFPMCELLAYSTTYVDSDTMVKEGRHKVGVRWTALEKDEDTATMAAELLCTATVELFWNPFYAGYLPDSTVNAGSVIVIEEDYSPLLPDPKGAFLKGGTVVVEITTYRS